LPDLSGGILESCPRQVFITESDSDEDRALYGFILSLALMYNDFKSLNYWFYQLQKFKPSSQSRACAYRGEWAGLQWHLLRLYFGNFVELLRAIKGNQKNNWNKAVLEHPIFSELLSRVSEGTRECWQDLLSARESRFGDIKVDRNVFAHLERVRNAGIHHYGDTKDLLRGYQHFFNKDTNAPLNNEAYFCAGDSIEKTRFYFADAAAQGIDDLLGGYFAEDTGIDGRITNFLHGFAPRINRSLRYLVEEFIKYRLEEIQQKDQGQETRGEQ
jgi:hypothetical protein